MTEPQGSRALLTALTSGVADRIREFLHLDVVAFRRNPHRALSPLHGPDAVARELSALIHGRERWTLCSNAPDTVVIQALEGDRLSFSLEARLEGERAVGLLIRNVA